MLSRPIVHTLADELLTRRMQKAQLHLPRGCCLVNSLRDALQLWGPRGAPFQARESRNTIVSDDDISIMDLFLSHEDLEGHFYAEALAPHLMVQATSRCQLQVVRGGS